MQLTVLSPQKVEFTRELIGAMELGRQRDVSEPEFEWPRSDGQARLVIAPMSEAAVSRKHVMVELLPPSQVIVEALRPLEARTADTIVSLPANARRTFQAPLDLVLGSRTVRIEAENSVDTGSQAYQTLSRPTLSPKRLAESDGPLTADELAQLTGAASTGLMRWLQAVIGVLQSAATSTDKVFYERAARGLVELVGLETGAVVLWDGGEWRIEAVETSRPVPPQSRAWKPSHSLLGRVRRKKGTVWQTPDSAASLYTSMVGIEAVVAAPILDDEEQVIGVLYGDRRQSTAGGGLAPLPQVTRAEALLVETLATAVAVGLARLHHEHAASAARARFEQFFTRDLAQHLAEDPNLLSGREAEVTILFCDVRGFSGVSERIDTARALKWINCVLDTLSECVFQHEGVLIDYVGDELMAMWGAPSNDQPDHAQRACRAALAMMAALPTLSQECQSITGEPLQIGIGLNTGRAHVGNVGSKLKFKYGAMGDMVNVASRVQGATKYLKTPLLITEHTRQQLDGAFKSRRLATVALTGIKNPVTLYAVRAAEDVPWQELCDRYERALKHCDDREYRDAARVLGDLLRDYREDGPALVLLQRAVAQLVDDKQAFDPWVLPGK